MSRMSKKANTSVRTTTQHTCMAFHVRGLTQACNYVSETLGWRMRPWWLSRILPLELIQLGGGKAQPIHACTPTRGSSLKLGLGGEEG